MGYTLLYCVYMRERMRRGQCLYSIIVVYVCTGVLLVDAAANLLKLLFKVRTSCVHFKQKTPKSFIL